MLLRNAAIFFGCVLEIAFAATFNGTNVMKIKVRNKIETKINRTNTGIETDRNLTEDLLEKRTFFPPDLHRVVLALETLPEGLCKNDSRAVMEAVVSRQRWALKMFDSSPKFPVGMLYGTYYQLGNFDECISIKKILDSNRPLLGKYCLANIFLDNTPSSTERLARSHGHFHDHGPRSRIAFDNTLHWAICVPSSCHPKEAELFLDTLFKIAISYKAVNITVEEKNCYCDEPIPFSNLEIFYGSLVGVFLAFVLLATVYNLLQIYQRSKSLHYSISTSGRPSVYQELALSFSIVQNVKKLLHISESDLNLDCISGIRFMSMILIIASHTLLFIISGPVSNEAFYSEAVKKPQNAILLNNPLLVDTFLLLSGFLMCRLLLIELEKRNGKINFLFIYIGRYVRLTPAYLVVIVFYCTYLIRLDNGPLWNDVIATEKDRCLSSWWANLLYINNYVNTDNICMFQSWYLAADTQLFVLAPIIIYPLWKWPRFGEILLGIVTATAAIIPFIVTYLYGLDPTLMAFPSEMTDITRNFYFVFAYIKTHARATPYCIGLVAGYVVHRLQSSNIKLSTNLVRSSWILSAVFGISSVYSITVFYLPEHQQSDIESAAYSALHKIAWSISIGWIIIACVMDHSGPVRKFLSWTPFLPLSRLTYCAYLMNGLIELHGFGTLRSPTYMSVYSMAGTTLAHLMLTFTAGFILCVLFESPIHGLERIILRREVKHQNTNGIESNNRK